MTARNQDFEMNQGETKKIVIDQTDDEDNGGDLDITGYQELKWVLKDSEGGETLSEKTESDSSDVSIVDVDVGAYQITIQPSETESLEPYTQELYHRVHFTDSTGNESDLLEGHIIVHEV